MKLEITLIRSGMTDSEREGRFPVPGDALSGAAARDLAARRAAGMYPPVARVYTGPARRCVETAALVYRGFPALALRELAPVDYGGFGGRRQGEMAGDSGFLDWASAEGVGGLAGGDSVLAAAMRYVKAMTQIGREAEAYGISSCAVIAHKVALMTILNRFAEPLHHYYNMEIGHGGGCAASFDTRKNVLIVKNTF